MTARLVAFVIWAAVAASAVFWALRLLVQSPSAPSHTVAVGAAAAPRGDLTRLFGAAPVAANAMPVVPALAARFRLIGVAAPREGGDRIGLASIAIDGKPARSYAVGAPVDGDMVLQAVHARGAKLGPRGASAQVVLDLPRQPPAATGTLPLGGVTLPGGVGMARGQPVPFTAPPAAGSSDAVIASPSIDAPPTSQAPQSVPR